MEKVFFFAWFVRNISKMAKIILIKKIWRNHCALVYNKSLISEHRKNYIFRDNKCFVKMSVSTLVCASEPYQMFVDAQAQKLV